MTQQELSILLVLADAGGLQADGQKALATAYRDARDMALKLERILHELIKEIEDGGS